MIWNIALLFLVFGAERKKISPYAAAALFGGVKGGLVLLVTRSLMAAVIVAAFYALLASAFVFFLQRVNRREAKEQPDVPKYSTTGSDKMTFRWEYIPLVILLLAIIGGEYVLAAGF
jgi:hypothetical protein